VGCVDRDAEDARDDEKLRASPFHTIRLSLRQPTPPYSDENTSNDNISPSN